MGETLLSVLCSQPWHQDSKNQNVIQFNRDGGGHLVARSELNVWIAAEIEWKSANGTSLDKTVDGSSQETADVTEFDIEMTLTKRRVSWVSDRPKVNEQVLLEEAFKPKVYKLKLTEGAFATPYDLALPKIPDWAPRFRFHLTWDRAPYPPREEWIKASGGVAANKFWERNEFVGREVEKSG